MIQIYLFLKLKSNILLIFYKINQMESMKTIFLLSILAYCSLADIQTGYVDMNQQLGNMEIVNQDFNAVCYTQIFAREFSSIPKVATCLAQFDTQSRQNYQIEIRIRKIELSETNAKFMVFARSQISIWNRIVFSYLATDRDDISVSTVHFETQDLSGCGRILAMSYNVHLDRSYDNLHVLAFINGFDVGVIQYGESLTDFEVSVEISEKYKDSFEVTLRRATPTQIYSVSIGYLATDPKASKDNFDYVQKTLIFDSIEVAQPFVDEIEHGMNLKNSQFFVGLQKFSFNNKQQDKFKSLALSFHEDTLIIASLDSTNLDYIQVSFVVLKQKITCEQNEIIVHKDEPSRLQCQPCDGDKYRIPNENLDECICQDGHFEIKSECFKLPVGAYWNEDKRTFICEEGLTMTFSKKEHYYKCRVAPKHKMWDSENQKWICMNDYYQIEGDCQTLPENSYYDKENGKFECKPGFFFLDGICGKSYENEEWSPSLKKFVCKENYYRIKQTCLKPFQNSFYDQISKIFVCQGGYYLRQEGVCEKTPQFMKYDYELQKLICEDGYYFIEEIEGCAPMPQNMKYNQVELKFICEENHYHFEGKCREPGQNQEWSAELTKFKCIKDTYRVKKGFCLYPIANSHYSEISEDFQCDEGYYDVQEKCISPPENMKYEATTKVFVCIGGYQDIDDECIKIPENKYWVKELSRFNCVEGFFELQDESCRTLGENQQYLVEKKKIACISDYYRLNGKCKALPKHAKYNEEDEDFVCQDKFFRQEETCNACLVDCGTCQSQNTCSTCRDGFKISQKVCVEECGDGKRFKAQCDDGNTQNGDGCSQNCKIQQGWKCLGGSPKGPDSCKQNSPVTKEEKKDHSDVAEHMQVKMVGMSHLYGKVILNIKVDYIPQELLNNHEEMTNMFRILTNAQIPLKVTSVYIDKSKYTFVVLYDFQNYEPIPEYLTRIELNPDFKERYYPQTAIKPLFIRINPAFMAKKDKDQQDSL